LGIIASVPTILLGLVAVHLLVKPLDELWSAFMARLLG
jgi:ABC-type phosphate transport system permease subunit